jgi:hypothetical protein
MPPKLCEFLEVDEPDWVRILEESANVEQAKHIHPVTHLTPMHLAAMAKENTRHNNPVRVGAIQSLLQSDLGAMSVQCHKHGCVVTNFTQLENKL